VAGSTPRHPAAASLTAPVDPTTSEEAIAPSNWKIAA
jgi:hypothetical protein